MIITIDTEHPPTPVELKHLWNLLTDVEPGDAVGRTIAAVAEARDSVAELKDEVAEKRKRTAAKAKAVVADDQTPQQQAIAVATRLVSEDKTEVVRAALEAIDEERVSKLTEDKAIAFLEALES